VDKALVQFYENAIKKTIDKTGIKQENCANGYRARANHTYGNAEPYFEARLRLAVFLMK